MVKREFRRGKRLYFGGYSYRSGTDVQGTHEGELAKDALVGYKLLQG